MRKKLCTLMLLTIICTLIGANVTKATANGEYMSGYLATIRYSPVGKFMKDATNEKFYSQEYSVYIDNVEIKNYTIELLEGFPEGSYVANINTGEKQEEFSIGEKSFKIMVPLDKAEQEDFIAKFKTNMSFKTYTTYYSYEGKLNIIDTDDDNIQIKEIDNRHSNLSINVTDAETLEQISNVKIQVEDKKFNVTEEVVTNGVGKAIIEKIGSGDASVKIIEAPNKYAINGIEQIETIGYNESAKINIQLKHKKGSLRVENNAINSSFEIYDSKGNLVGCYKTDEEGIIEIEELDIGDYLLIQKQIENGYVQAEDVKFSINENKQTQLFITNELKEIETSRDEEQEKVPEADKMDKEEQDKELEVGKEDKIEPEEVPEAGKEEQEEQEKVSEADKEDKEEQEKEPEVGKEEKEEPEKESETGKEEKEPEADKEEKEKPEKEPEADKEEKEKPEKEPELGKEEQEKEPELDKENKEEEEKETEVGKEEKEEQEKVPDENKQDIDEQNKTPVKDKTNRRPLGRWRRRPHFVVYNIVYKEEPKEDRPNDILQDEDNSSNKNNENSKTNDKENEIDKKDEDIDKALTIKEEENKNDKDSNLKNYDKLEEGKIDIIKTSNSNYYNEEKLEQLSNIDELKVKQPSNIDELLNKLPRTGDDYFLPKLILLDTVIFVAVMFVWIMKNKRQPAKKQTAFISNIKE